jgi:hypothetical protein
MPSLNWKTTLFGLTSTTFSGSLGLSLFKSALGQVFLFIGKKSTQTLKFVNHARMSVENAPYFAIARDMGLGWRKMVRKNMPRLKKTMAKMMTNLRLLPCWNRNNLLPMQPRILSSQWPQEKWLEKPLKWPNPTAHLPHLE